MPTLFRLALAAVAVKYFLTNYEITQWQC